MNRFVLFLVFMMLSAASAFATHVAVLETVADGAAKDNVSLQDRQYLTNVLREEAVKQLPAVQNYTIMTRDNILQMLPPGKAIEDCEGSCLVETGKNISADYVCQARVSTFGSSITLSAELYETAGNKLIASFNGRGSNVEELLEVIERKSADFFKVIKDANQNNPQEFVAQPEYVEPQSEPDSVANSVEEVENPAEDVIEPARDSIVALANEAYDEIDGNSEPQVGESIPTNVSDGNVGEGVPSNVSEEMLDEGGIHWIPLGVSAVVAVMGVVLAVAGNNLAKDAREEGFTSTDQYERNKDKAHKGQILRGVGIGLAIAGAVGIGLSVAF
jgi:hypothetical protein